MINPYNSIDWGSTEKIISISHAHCRAQEYFENAVAGGLEHFAFSNYYPSEPYADLAEYFTNIPSYAISSPNAEHHGFNVSRCHLNGLGSTLKTGNPRGTSPVGMATIGISTWSGAIDAILRYLQFNDAGGVTINHPIWTGLPIDLAKKMLDHDPRVLGIEICNEVGHWETYHTTEDLPNPYALEYWDNILITGRRCWGFCVPDHEIERSKNWTGRNILLTNDKTNYGCLKAYREGHFYSKIFNSDLDFTSISLADHTLQVSVANADYISVIVDGVKTQYTSGSITVQIPNDAVYCRVEAAQEVDWVSEQENAQKVVNRVFSNPIIFKEYISKTDVSNDAIIPTVLDL